MKELDKIKKQSKKKEARRKLNKNKNQRVVATKNNLPLIKIKL